MGFEELTHTADWAMRVWAPDLPSLFAEAARGMNALSGARFVPSQRPEHSEGTAEGLVLSQLPERGEGTAEGLVPSQRPERSKGTAEGPRLRRLFETQGSDAESLLVTFLTELIYYAEQENLAFDQFEINVETFERANVQTLKVEMEGAPLESLTKAIKAVTYHNLHIHQTARGYEVEIVFDV